MEIQTTVEFDAAHRLSFHNGKCKNLHGHRWKCEIILGRENYEDMVADFGDIKDLIKNKFDHKVLVYEQDDVLMIASQGFEREVLPAETTAENIAMIIRAMVFAEVLAKNVKDQKEKIGIAVTVYETPNNAARC
jgi:6-pyruvoyltetrahydropterin/6-carboxytetrahydropterin synthase